MFERFTDRARSVVKLAQDEARAHNHDYIGTEHILLGLIHEGEGMGLRTLKSLEISLQDVREQVGEEAPPAEPQELPHHIPFTPRAKKVLELALREALQLGHNYIGTEHILLGLIHEENGVAAQVLTRLGADLDRVRRQVALLTIPAAEATKTLSRNEPLLDVLARIAGALERIEIKLSRAWQEAGPAPQVEMSLGELDTLLNREATE